MDLLSSGNLPTGTPKRTERSELRPGFLRPKAAATYLDISPSLLAKQIRLGTGPKFRKIGRVVLFKVADLDSWMEEAVCS
jgi:predicted DNA-binding transcriptional regulator AlpA